MQQDIFCYTLPFSVNPRFLDTTGMDSQKGEETNSKTDPVLGGIDLGSEEEKSKEPSEVNTKRNVKEAA